MLQYDIRKRFVRQFLHVIDERTGVIVIAQIARRKMRWTVVTHDIAAFAGTRCVQLMYDGRSKNFPC
jgi:hypothetical protein